MLVSRSRARSIASGTVRSEVAPLAAWDPAPLARSEEPLFVDVRRPAVAFLMIESVQSRKLGSLDIADARNAGFRTVEALLRWFRGAHGEHPKVVVVRFHVVGGDAPLLLARRSELAYTSSAAEAIQGEPEAIRTEELNPSWLQAAEERKRSAQRSNPEYVRKLASRTASQVREQLVARGRRGENIEPLIESLQQLLRLDDVA